MAAGADVNSGSPPPLMAAVFNGHLECVKLLIQAGADLNVQDENGRTTLMFAAAKGHVDCVKLLTEAGADLDIWHEYGFTALMIAALDGSETCFKTLLNAGADVNMTLMSVINARKLLKLNEKEGKIISFVMSRRLDGGRFSLFLTNSPANSGLWLYKS